MKTKLILFSSVFFTLSAVAQYGLTDNQRAGAAVYGPIPSTPQQQKNLLLKDYSAADLIRVASGKIYNIQNDNAWQAISGEVSYKIPDGVLIMANGSRNFAITNYSGEPTQGKEVTILSIRSGNYDWDGTPLELYDCGKNYVPPPPTPEQIAAAQEATRLRAIESNRRYLIGQTNAVRFLFTEATNGNASAQCSLGEHYLAGLGCETNRDLAIQWLQKAADGGSMEASNKLSQLKSP